MANIKKDVALSYDDVFIVPKFSTIRSRKHVDLTADLGGDYGKIKVPIMAANMETVINEEMAIALNKAGACGALHRFQTIDESVSEFKTVNAATEQAPTFVSIGVNRDSQDRAKALYEAGARHFVIDIAHGHSIQMKEMIAWLRKELDHELYIVGGNVATGNATWDLISWGANCVKCGIAGGSVCRTKNVTGVTVPMVSSILECKKAVSEAESYYRKNFQLIADGGCVEIGDVCKAIGAGANLVMSGRFFAACDESPNGTTYRGSASETVQEKYRTDSSVMPTPEGTTEELEKTGPVSEVVELIAGGLRSSFSYCNALNMQEFHKNCNFGIRHNKS